MRTRADGDAGPPKAAAAVVRGENTLAVALVISRTGALVMLAASLAPGPWHTSRALPVLVLATIAFLSSLALIVSCLVTGRVGRAIAALDVICVVAVVGLSSVPAVVPGAPDQSPFYNFSVVAVVAFALPKWPLVVVLAAAGGLAVVNIVAAVRPGSSYPMWNALPDSATFVSAGALVWVLAWLVRTSAQSLDRHHNTAVVRAAALARERERAREQHDLGAHLLFTMDELADGEAIAEPRVREQVQREARWLRQVVDSGLPELNDALSAALRNLVADKTAAGMQVELELPDAEPELSAAAVGSVVDAVREALTNVAKHAGTTRADVVVRRHDRGLVVEVTDTGRGYRPASAPSRVGQSRSIRDRIEAMGGRVEFESAPGSGTRVRLWIPAGGWDRA